MKDYINIRTIDEALYILDNKATVRDTAKEFKTSKSTVHKDMTERLPQLNEKLAAQVRGVLDYNKDERNIRGGMSTYLKWRAKQVQ